MIWYLVILGKDIEHARDNILRREPEHLCQPETHPQGIPRTLGTASDLWQPSRWARKGQLGCPQPFHPEIMGIIFRSLCGCSEKWNSKIHLLLAQSEMGTQQSLQEPGDLGIVQEELSSPVLPSGGGLFV